MDNVIDLTVDSDVSSVSSESSEEMVFNINEDFSSVVIHWVRKGAVRPRVEEEDESSYDDIVPSDFDSSDDLSNGAASTHSWMMERMSRAVYRKRLR